MCLFFARIGNRCLKPLAIPMCRSGVPMFTCAAVIAVSLHFDIFTHQKSCHITVIFPRSCILGGRSAKKGGQGMLGEFRDPSQDGDWSKVEAQQPKFFVYPMIFRQLGSPLLAALLAVAWPAANFLSYNFGLIRTGGGSFASIGTFTVVVAVFIVAIAAICVRLDRTMQAKRLLVAVAVLFPMLFVFQPASRPLSSLLLAWTSQARLLAAVLFLLAWCATGYAAWRLASKRRAVALFTIFLVVACAMPVASVAYQSLSVPWAASMS